MSDARLVIPLGLDGAEGILSIHVDSDGDVVIEDDEEAMYTIDRPDFELLVAFVRAVGEHH